MPDTASRLLDIARMIRDHDLAKLAELQMRRRNADETRRAFLEAAEAENAQAPKDLAYRANIETWRFIWRQQHLYALTHHTARSAAEVEAQKRVAARSFGRAQSLEAALSKRGG